MGSLLLVLIYVCFISLGLPDSLLGSAWPVLHEEISVPFSFAGIISSVICICTIISSLFSDKLLRKFGAGKVTAVSVFLTAAALFGFSMSGKFWMLILWSIPYGIGAGGVDSILNNFVALHYKAQHMSWLHCMWGLGAATSPYIMSFALLKLDSWNHGYLIVSIIQIVLSVVIFASLPAWKKGIKSEEEKKESSSKSIEQKPLPIKEVFKIKGAVPCFFAFFAYCSLELTASLWSCSYFVEKWSLSPETAAAYGSMFYIGLTFGRLLNGFLAMKLGDHFLIRLGSGVILGGLIMLLIPVHPTFSLIGFIIVGLGCAPVYPCIIHMTPNVFGEDKSQAMIGVQMAFAYTGFLIMPPLFGVIADYISISLMPIYILAILIVMVVMHELVIIKNKKTES